MTFGMVAATGARILTAVDFKDDSRNLFVVAIPVGFGMISIVAPTFFRTMPDAPHPLFDSGILLAALASVLLNAFFNGVAGAEGADRAAAAMASAAEHP